VPDPPTAERDTLVAQLRRDIDSELDTDALRHWCTWHCCLRYLRARKWKYDKALEMLRKSVEWRREVQPESIRWDDLPEQMVTGKIIVPRSGDVCLQGRPVVLMENRRNTKEAMKDATRMIRHMVYWLEAASRQADAMPEADGKMVWVINQTGYKASNAPPFKVSLECLSILQNHYPERLGLAIMYNFPTAMGFFWNMIRPFIDPVTATKVQFVNLARDVRTTRQAMGKHFDLARLDLAVEGDADWFGRADGEQLSFDAEGYRKFMVKQEEQLRKDIAAHAKKGANWYLDGSQGGSSLTDGQEGGKKRRGWMCFLARPGKGSRKSGREHTTVYKTV